MGGYEMEKSKEELANQAYELAVKYEMEYLNESQCTLAAIQDTLGMRNDDIFKAATGLAGGIGATGLGPCGALTAGVVAISSKIGRERKYWKDPEKIRWKTYELARQLCARFIEEYGGIHCGDILKKLLGRSYNLWDPAEYEAYEKAGGHNKENCPTVAGNAAKWTVEILLEQN